MAFELRDYQMAMVEEARGAFMQGGQSVLVRAPTGSGKTALAAFMVQSATAKGNRVWFMVHRRELLKQTARTFDMVGTRYGLIAAGQRPNNYHQVQIASVQTLARRLDTVFPPDLIIWDECHHLGAASWDAIFKAYPRARHIGLTATPVRLDGKGLGRWFKSMVSGPPVRWLIENGYLSDYRVFAPPGPDMAGVRRTAGDFNRHDSAEVMDTGKIVGDAVAHYQRLLPGKRAIVFCVSIAHAEHVADRFRAAGIDATNIDGKLDTVTRDRRLAAFERGDVPILTSIDLVGEGFDLPAIEGAILMRPTQSLALHLQQMGRALRPSPGKTEAVILDHAGNTMRHGLPCHDFDWTLADPQRRKRQDGESEAITGIRQCPSCYFIHAPAPHCPECGHVYQLAREVSEVDGDLVEVDPEAERRAYWSERGRAQTLDDLVQFGKLKGYKNPWKWASAVYNARQAKRGAA